MSSMYGNWFEGCINAAGANYDWNAPTNGIKIALITDGYSIGIEETVMTTAGGQRATGGGATDQTVTEQDCAAAAGVVVGDVTDTDVTWTAVPATQTVDAIVPHAFLTDDSDSLPISYNEFTPIICNGSNIKITFGSSIWTITYS